MGLGLAYTPEIFQHTGSIWDNNGALGFSVFGLAWNLEQHSFLSLWEYNTLGRNQGWYSRVISCSLSKNSTYWLVRLITMASKINKRKRCWFHYKGRGHARGQVRLCTWSEVKWMNRLHSAPHPQEDARIMILGSGVPCLEVITHSTCIWESSYCVLPGLCQGLSGFQMCVRHGPCPQKVYSAVGGSYTWSNKESLLFKVGSVHCGLDQLEQTSW